MLKQEIVYIPKEIVNNGTFPIHFKEFKPKQGYFLTKEELQKLLEDTFDDATRLCCYKYDPKEFKQDKEEYITKLLNE